MKRLLSVAVILLLSVSVLAGNGPKKLSFCNTQIIQGKNKNELYKKAALWKKQREIKDGIPDAYLNDFDSRTVRYSCHVKNCKNFGVSTFIIRYGTAISFDVMIKCRENSYTAEVSGIDVSLNPDIGILYGENGELYPEMYNKKQLKLSIPIIEYVSGLADDIFLEIKEYMTGN